MKTRSTYTATGASLALFLLSGCHAFYPPGPYPGMYQPGRGPMMPPQATKTTFVAPGDVPATSPTPAEPSDQGNSPRPSGTFAPSGPIRAPEYRPDNDSGDDGGRDSLVPEPRDPGASADDPSERTSERPVETSAVEPDSSRLPRAASGDRVFLRPVGDDGAGGTQVVAAAHDQPLRDRRPSGPLGRARDYQWVQGELQYDLDHDTWHLVYDRNPAQNDPQGGEMTIVTDEGNPEFVPSDNEKVFRIYGRRDPSRLDRLGKPVYHMTRAQLVEFAQ